MRKHNLLRGLILTLLLSAPAIAQVRSTIRPANEPVQSNGGCGDGKVCCNVYDDWPEKGRKICLPEDQCTGIGKDVVPDSYCN